MRKANLKHNPSSTICAVIEPPPSSPRGIDPATGEVIGFRCHTRAKIISTPGGMCLARLQLNALIGSEKADGEIGNLETVNIFTYFTL